MKKQCIVIFPIYKTLTPIESSFLENGIAITKDFDQIIIAPKQLLLNSSFGSLQQLEIKYFDNYYFDCIEGYNKLMLSKEFYHSFKEYEYILIHQADVYLFKNDLAYWCDKKYDYIGAPWIKPNIIKKGEFYAYLHKKIWQSILSINRTNGWLYNKVGNGGLSLRHVSSAIEVLEKTPQGLLEIYLTTVSPHYNEDIFWAIEAKKIRPAFKIPGWKIALKFAFEMNPKESFKATNSVLPFGCHAPLKNNPSFWKKLIPLMKND